MKLCQSLLLLCCTTAFAQITVAADDRADFAFNVDIAAQLDNFTASELQNALNPQDSGDTEIDYGLNIRAQYKVYEQDDGDKLWLYGQTIRTVRSAEVVCAKAPKFFGCAQFDGSFGVDDIPSRDVAFSILRDAESIEGYLGLRYEFDRIETEGFDGELYVNLETGFASVEGSSDDLASIHHVGLGVVLTESDFANSFLEIGYGKNSLFQDATNRGRLRTRVERKFPIVESLRFFLETEIDFDGSDGADSIRTQIGFTFDL